MNRKEAKPLGVLIKIRGWDRRGIQTFNVIVSVIHKDRESIVSENMELELNSRYKIMSRNGISKNENNSGSNDDDLNKLNGYDRFECGMELDRTTNIDKNTTDEFTGVTNQIYV